MTSRDRVVYLKQLTVVNIVAIAEHNLCMKLGFHL